MSFWKEVLYWMPSDCFRLALVAAIVGLYLLRTKAKSIFVGPPAEMDRFPGRSRMWSAWRSETLDEDAVPAGKRRLLRLRLSDFGRREEGGSSSNATPVPKEVVHVLFTIRCASTGALRIVTVPPETLTCRQAAEWIADLKAPGESQVQVVGG